MSTAATRSARRPARFGLSGGAGLALVAASVATAAPANADDHVVRSGDTVSHLALRYGTSVNAIVAANHLNSQALIRIGQTLQIPGRTTTTTPSPTPAPSASRTHTVRAGDSVWLLANQYGTTVNAIVAANHLDSRALIRIGQTLQIPGQATPSGSSTPLVGDSFAGRTYPPATVASANQNRASLLSIGVPSRTHMQALIAATARDMGVDPALALAIAYQESGFDHSQVSPANAIGVMQVIPSSGQWASDLVGRDLNLLDPNDNVVAGVAILRQLLRSADTTSNAIAGYYQGLSSVRRHGMFTDTERYVANVQALAARFA